MRVSEPRVFFLGQVERLGLMRGARDLPFANMPLLFNTVLGVACDGADDSQMAAAMPSTPRKPTSTMKVYDKQRRKYCWSQRRRYGPGSR